MKIIKTNCIVLKKKEMKEADLQVTLFSKDYGKIMATAYGIRKSNKRNVVSLNPLNEVEITLSQKNNYYVVKEVEIIKNFNSIIKNINKLEISLLHNPLAFIVKSFKTGFFTPILKRSLYFKSY